MTVNKSKKNRKKTEKYIENCWPLEANHKDLGFELGKLYKFSGRFRMVYPEKKDGKPINRNEKINNGDLIVILGTELVKHERGVIRTTSCYSTPYSVAKKKSNLVSKGYIINSVYQDNFSKYFKIIKYHSKYDTYSGRIQVIHNGNVGWINIKMLANPEIKKQFQIFNYKENKNDKQKRS